VKYFFDNNLPPKFAELLRLVSGESIVHIDAADGLHRDTKDEKWMPIVAQRNWVAVTSGVRISTAPHQRELRQQLGIATVFQLKG